MLASQKFTCFLMGEQSRLIQCGKILLQKGHHIYGVISSEPSIKQWAEENRLDQIMPGDDIVTLLKQQSFDLFFSIDNFSKVPVEILSLPLIYAINFHDAPLPKYAGTNATNWALMNCENRHGITWHVMTDMIDGGEILKQKTFFVSDHETALSLNAKCYEESIRCFEELIDEIAENRIQPVGQNLKNRTFYPRWKRPDAACTIDWANSAEEIHALFRGLDFGTYPNPLGLPKLFIGDDVVIVKRADILNSVPTSPPGTITKVTDKTINVATSTREIILKDFNSYGRTPLSPSNFLTKFGLGDGDIFPELEDERRDKITRVHSEFSRHEDFWKHRLSIMEPIEIPYAKWHSLRDPLSAYSTAPYLTPDKALGGESIAEKPGDLILAALLLYFYRTGDKSGFDVGFQNVSLQKKLQGVEAFFATTIPLHIDVIPEHTFDQFCNLVVKSVEEVSVHGSYTRDLILRDPELRKSFKDSTSLNFPVSVERVKKLSDFISTGDSYLTIVIPDDGKECIWLYSETVLDKEAVERMQHQFSVLYKDIAKGEMNRSIAELSILPEQERKLILENWNDTMVDYPQNICLHQLFEEQVKRTPKAVAVDYEGKQLTYQELNSRGNQLANYLKASGIGPEKLVGLFMERSLDMVIGIYGIIKAGGAYVPLDPEYPPDRVAYMIEDTKVPMLLTQKHLVSRLPEHKAHVLCLDSEWEMIAKEKRDNIESGCTAGNLAYVIYTSGSTGKPKGVMNEHRGIVNRLLWMQDEYGLTGEDRILQKTPFSFDVSVWEFLWPLLVGARLVMARPGGHKDSAYLVKMIIENKITTLHFVPSMLQIFLEEERVENCLSIKRVICSGEALPYELKKRFFERLDTELHNLYGPTEAAVDVTYWPCQRESEYHFVPIGFPVANTQIYILDPQLQPVPVGISGELHIGGIQVARGYLNRPGLTQEKFIPDPIIDKPDARLYKTGDLARYLNDGSIEYIGRTDFQVKIRGLRIELGEIETLITEYEGVSQSVVVLREDRLGEKSLVAYLVPDSDHDVSLAKLRGYLRAKLPDYMVPQHFVKLDSIPLTPNGKADRRALPKPDAGRISDQIYVAPRNQNETLIADIWKELLDLNKVGINDSFFDLGGHSLLLVKMLRRLRKSFPGNLSIVDLFQYPTIATLNAFLADSQSVKPSFAETFDIANKQIASLKRQKRLANARREFNG